MKKLENSIPDGVQKEIARFVKALKSQSGESIPDEWIVATAKAMRGKKMGAPIRRAGRHMEISRKLFAFRISDAAKVRGAIGQFEDELADHYSLSDSRKIRGIYKRNWVKVAVETITYDDLMSGD